MTSESQENPCSKMTELHCLRYFLTIFIFQDAQSPDNFRLLRSFLLESLLLYLRLISAFCSFLTEFRTVIDTSSLSDTSSPNSFTSQFTNRDLLKIRLKLSRYRPLEHVMIFAVFQIVIMSRFCSVVDNQRSLQIVMYQFWITLWQDILMQDEQAFSYFAVYRQRWEMKKTWALCWF